MTTECKYSTYSYKLGSKKIMNKCCLFLLVLNFSQLVFCMEKSPFEKLKSSIGRLINSPKQKKLTSKTPIETDAKRKTVNTSFYEKSILDGLESNSDGVAELIIITTAKEKVTWEMLCLLSINTQRTQAFRKIVTNYSIDINSSELEETPPIIELIEQINKFRDNNEDAEKKAKEMLDFLLESKCFNSSLECHNKLALELTEKYKLDDIKTKLESKFDSLKQNFPSETKKENPIFARLRSFSVPNIFHK